jgi:hypothetical protein
MNDHGKPGACIEMKRGSLVINFAPDKRWNSTANDTSHSKRSGSYEIQGRHLVMKNADGSLYQDWQPDLSPDGRSFGIADKGLIETFARLAQAEPYLE